MLSPFSTSRSRFALPCNTPESDDLEELLTELYTSTSPDSGLVTFFVDPRSIESTGDTLFFFLGTNTFSSSSPASAHLEVRMFLIVGYPSSSSSTILFFSYSCTLSTDTSKIIGECPSPMLDSELMTGKECD
ncbi:Os02g0602201 [Oryza sativa Japonica Group]|uniref:Os02g0602201 protein n=1 Tax=Oryza sativa subsp. japonica TaxID=39947 RepID=A0A0N7KFM4_ORYSJ|nr:hypothetical protein EE612_012251 [Oryza sativa]BAS79625.1 Os02g0602201 [Oryza sativa Japonica Group]